MVLPLVVPNEYYLQILTQGYMFAISACGLNVILGFAGQLSLAHAGFFGIGAYTVALLATKAGVSFWLGLPAGIALCAVSGFAVGSICLRSKGHYFAIFTMAVGIIIHLVIQKWESLTHGHIGVIGIPGPGPIGPISFESTHRALVPRARLPGRDAGGDDAAGALAGRPHADGGARERAAGGGGRHRRDGGQAPGLHDLGGARRPGRRPLRRLHRLSRARIRRTSR